MKELKVSKRKSILILLAILISSLTLSGYTFIDKKLSNNTSLRSNSRLERNNPYCYRDYYKFKNNNKIVCKPFKNYKVRYKRNKKDRFLYKQNCRFKNHSNKGYYRHNRRRY